MLHDVVLFMQSYIVLVSGSIRPAGCVRRALLFMGFYRRFEQDIDASNHLK